MDMDTNLNQVPVPKPELDLALKTIDETVTSNIEKYIRRIQDEDEGDNQNDNETEGEKDKQSQESTSASASASVSAIDSLSRLKQEIISTLESSIQNAVVPIDETEYRQSYIVYDTPMRKDIQKAERVLVAEADENDIDDISLDENDNDDYDDDDNYSESLDSFQSESSEEEEEDLIDTVALQRAKELREQVRQKAAATRAMKDAKVSMLVQYIASQLDEWKKLSTCSSNSSNSSKVDENDNENEKHVQVHQRIQPQLEQMRTSLSKLESTLQSIDLELPDKLESLQDSIETIRHYITKKEQQQQGSLQPSRTERAILSRVDTNKQRTEKELSNVDNDDMDDIVDDKLVKINSKLAEMDAEQRFALFVSQVNPW